MVAVAVAVVVVAVVAVAVMVVAVGHGGGNGEPPGSISDARVGPSVLPRSPRTMKVKSSNFTELPIMAKMLGIDLHTHPSTVWTYYLQISTTQIH